MKKGNLFLSLLTAAAISFGAVSAPVLAEDVQMQEQQISETEAEHPAGYYLEIQSNNIKNWPQGAAVNAEAAIVMDADTGAILYAKNIDQKEYPASITKIMTTLLALEKGNLKDTVKFSEYAVYSIEYNSSHLGMTEGEELTLEQCLYGIMLASANEISNAVAEHIGGDVDTFVNMMNERAKELGCTGTHFVNPHGLHDDNHYVTARDMALISREAFNNKMFRKIIKTVEYHFPETNLVDEKRYFINHHKMISEEGMIYDDVIGGKTGFTDQAQNTLVTMAKRGNQRLLTVVLKAPGLYVSYDDTKVLLDYGFDSFDNTEISTANAGNVQIVGIEDKNELEKIRQADFQSGPISIEETAKVTVPQGIDASALVKNMDFGTNTLTYSYEGQLLGSVPFTYSGEWPEPESETQTDAAVPETEVQTEPEQSKSVLEKTKDFFAVIFGGIGNLYNQMDTFIKENTIIAVIIGAVLLLIFVPLLLVAINRHRKYMRLMELRHKEMEMRRRLEEEIEKKSAAQIEAELRAEELQMQLEDEKKKRQKLEEIELEELERMYFYDEQDSDAKEEKVSSTEKEETLIQMQDESQDESVETEDEYIEVPLENEEK